MSRAWQLISQFKRERLRHNDSKTNLLAFHHRRADTKLTPALIGGFSFNFSLVWNICWDKSPTSETRIFLNKNAGRNGMFRLQLQIVPGSFCKCRNRPKLEYFSICCIGLLNPHSPALKNVTFTQPFGWWIFSNLRPFPTDEPQSASRYAITFSIAHVQTRTLHPTYAGRNHPNSFWIPLVKKKFQSDKFFIRTLT